MIAEKTQYDTRHGSWYDRGAADSYYGRSPQPHRGGVGGYSGPRLTASKPNEIEAYMAGYRDNEADGDKKNWD